MKACFTLWLILSFLCFSCSSRKQIPADILGPAAMEKILFDIALAEEFAVSYLARDTIVDKDSAMTAEVEKVMKIHKTSQEKFRDSYDFYKSRPDLFKVIVDTVYFRSQRDKEKLYRGPTKVE